MLNARAAGGLVVRQLSRVDVRAVVLRKLDDTCIIRRAGDLAGKFSEIRP